MTPEEAADRIRTFIYTWGSPSVTDSLDEIFDAIKAIEGLITLAPPGYDVAELLDLRDDLEVIFYAEENDDQ